MNRDIRRSSSERVLLLVTKKFAKRVYLDSNITGKLFGTPTAAGIIYMEIQYIQNGILLMNRRITNILQPDFITPGKMSLDFWKTIWMF